MEDLVDCNRIFSKQDLLFRLMSAFGSLAVLRNLKLSLCGPGFEESIACSISLSQVATSLQVNGNIFIKSLLT